MDSACAIHLAVNRRSNIVRPAHLAAAVLTPWPVASPLCRYDITVNFRHSNRFGINPRTAYYTHAIAAVMLSLPRAGIIVLLLLTVTCTVDGCFGGTCGEY